MSRLRRNRDHVCAIRDQPQMIAIAPATIRDCNFTTNLRSRFRCRITIASPIKSAADRPLPLWDSWVSMPIPRRNGKNYSFRTAQLSISNCGINIQWYKRLVRYTKLPPIQDPGEESNHIGSIVCNFILYCKKLFLRLKLVITKSHSNNFTVASYLSFMNIQWYDIQKK